MYPVDARKETYATVEIFGIPGLYTPLKVDRATVPTGFYTYEMRASEQDWSQPDMISQSVTGELYGTVITASQIPFANGSKLRLAPGDFAESRMQLKLSLGEFENRCCNEKGFPALNGQPSPKKHRERLPVKNYRSRPFCHSR